MFEFASLVTASFAVPEEIGTTLWSLLLLLPVVASIAIVYKATKVPCVSAGNFTKESVLLFGSIVIFMVITALVLSAVAWLVTG